MSEHRGNFVWYDLMTTDTEAAKAFYTEVVGWSTQEWEEGLEEPYTMLVAGDEPFGGLMLLPEEARAMGAPPHWLAYVSLHDVDATLEQVRALGGTVLAGPIDIPKVGRFAIFADPQGAVLAGITLGGDDVGWEQPTGNGTMCWHELMTSDVDGALSFYETIFGWSRHEAMDMGPAGIYQLYGQAGAEQPLGGMMKITPDMGGMPPAWMYYVDVADLDGALARVAQRGGQVLHGPMEVPGGAHVAACTDPQGAHFALHSVAK
jgi:uncharacterized protein